MTMTAGDPEEKFDESDCLFELKVYKREKYADKLAISLNGNVDDDDVLLLEILQTIHDVIHDTKEMQSLKVLNKLLENNKAARKHMNKAAAEQDLAKLAIGETVN